MSDREERMKPVLDRIPEHWGKYLPDPGWDDILLELDAKLSEIDPDYVIHQAKEKFGTLRFYTSLPFEAGREAIQEAEAKSARTCENCGAYGAKARHSGWIKTLCDECNEAREERRRA